MNNRRVVVTGMGILSPLACGVEETWTRLLAGESGAGRIKHFDASHLSCQIACEIPLGDGSNGTFDADAWVAAKDRRKFDRFITYALTAAEQAVTDANWKPEDEEDQFRTGVMIGLPFQNTGHLADDLLFMRKFDVDMVGMGPYIEHPDTPLYQFRDQLLPIKDRFDLALKMVATLRILMKDINIAAATALQAIDPLGREKAVKVGANIIMPNITPGKYRNDYALYENKPCVDEEPEECKNCLDVRIKLADGEIGYDEWGDSKHFHKRLAGE